MKFISTDIRDLLILEPTVFGDERGYFLETYRREYFEDQGIDVEFIQDNTSLSQKGTIRGLHYQKRKHAQAKLMRVSRGAILDIAVDIRQESDTFGRHVAVELSEENHRQLYIPEGFAHGFAVLTTEAVIHYKCNRYYYPEAEHGIRWDDPDLKIDWRVSDPIVSDKDLNQPYFCDLNSGDLF
ncbi:MAG: dTDP-4-dehydrorhamnose 3,5-epimerase [Balneolaceae bacterium]